jgi:membrane protein implicated in regulation of membrane protease activity
MMIFTTLLVAAIIVAGLYFLVVRFIPWQGLSYGLMIVVGVACLLPGDVHFRYIGIEVAALGCLMVWIHHQFLRKTRVPNSST